MVPSEGNLIITRSAELFIRQPVPRQALYLSYINHFVRAGVVAEDVFGLGEHIQEMV